MKKSMLSPAQRRLFKALGAVCAFLLADTFYLVVCRQAEKWGWAFLHPDDLFLPVFQQALTLLHTGVGIVLMAAVLAFVLWHLPNALRRKRRITVASGIATVLLCATITASGFFIMTEAGSKQNAWVWQLHLACAVAVAAAYLTHRLRSFSPATWKGFGTFFGAAGAGAILLLAVHGTQASAYWKSKADRDKGGDDPSRRIGQMRLEPFRASAQPDLKNTFFPSLVATTGGGRNRPTYITRDEYGDPSALDRDLKEAGFVHRAKIGAQLCERCHPDVVDQWSASAHRFSSFNNPFYEAAFRNLVDTAHAPNGPIEEHLKEYPDRADKVSRIKSQWCAGCHDPALLFPGVTLDEIIDRRSPQAQAGLTCLGCHNITAVNGLVGNANYLFENQTEDIYLFSKGGNAVAKYLHDTAVKAKPAAHKKQMLKPVFRTPEFCSTCHKVNLDEPVNNYRWFRGQNEYDNWQDSGVAHGAARTFYLPPAAKICQDCHMPLEAAPRGDVSAKGGMVRSHRFLAVNTALPFLRGDEETIRKTEAFLRESRMRVTLMGLVRGRNGKEEEFPLDAPGAVDLRPGDEVELRAVVRNKGVGHTFPGGTNDSNEGWIRVEIASPKGALHYLSGGEDKRGVTDPDARFYRALMVDENSNPIRKRDAQNIRAAVYANVVGPGTADLGRYRFRVTEEMARDGFVARARLLWRKFDREYTLFACDRIPEGFVKFGGECPDLPVTEIARDEWSWKSGQAETALGLKDLAPADLWERVNDYGIALFLDGETAGAEKQFSRAAGLVPAGRPDGPRNLARVAFAEGNLEKTEDLLRECETIAPGDPLTAWNWGLLRQEQGLYEEAIAAYRRVVEAFPKERSAWRNMARVYYLMGDWDRSLSATDQALAIDPEDRMAHYTRMLTLRAAGRKKEAEQARAAYEKYQIDESSKQWTTRYRLMDPGANRLAQNIQVHELEPFMGKPFQNMQAIRTAQP